MQTLKKRIITLLREAADNIEVDNTHLTEQEAMDLMSILAHREMSKEEACAYMNMSKSKFDNHIREGLIPKGRKVLGFKELRWYQNELDIAVWKINQKKIKNKNTM